MHAARQQAAHGEVCYSVLQFVAVCCSVLQSVAVCCGVLRCVAVCRSTPNASTNIET